MEPDKTQEFFDAGLQNYAKALLAVHDFEDLLAAELQKAMLAQPETSTLKLASAPGFTTTRGSPPFYLAVFGTLAHPATDPSAANLPRVEVGAWWTPPFRSATGVVVYAGVSGVPWAKEIAKPEGFDGGLHKSKTIYLTRDLVKGAAFGEVVEDLLGHLDRACRKHAAP